jgi:hypothetical protein
MAAPGGRWAFFRNAITYSSRMHARRPRAHPGLRAVRRNWLMNRPTHSRKLPRAIAENSQ